MLSSAIFIFIIVSIILISLVMAGVALSRTSSVVVSSAPTVTERPAFGSKKFFTLEFAPGSTDMTGTISGLFDTTQTGQTFLTITFGTPLKAVPSGIIINLLSYSDSGDPNLPNSNSFPVDSGELAVINILSTTEFIIAFSTSGGSAPPVIAPFLSYQVL